jgi:hypothetical protein
MIIALSGQQWNSVSQRIPAGWKQAMKEHRTQTYGRSHNYDLPAICWRRLFDHLSAQATGPLGGNTQGPEALYSAISVIIRRVMQMEHHPALRGQAVTGWRPEIIPAWRSPHRLFSCYPVPDEPFVLLIPRHITERGWKLTTWVSAPDDDLLVAESLANSDEMELIFNAQTVTAGVDLGGVPQD